MVCLCFLLLSSLLLNNSLAWDTEQLEVFDVVDEVKKNFYELLNVSNDASSTEIRSAFRSLSLKLHPDKNLEKDTSEQFRNLVSVYEVLKSPSKRNYYNEVLVNGLPNWKSAMYYYRYVRKMGMSEACSILFIIITIGQYLVNWAAYFEKMFTINENLKRKKQFRKGKNIEDVYEIDYPSKPTFFNTLPFQIPKLIWSTTLSLPSAFGSIKRTVEQQIKDVSTIPGPQPPPPVKVKTVRKRNKFVVPEGPNFESSYTDGYVNGSTPLSAPSNVVGNLWSDDDLNELVRLVQKFPQGSSKRWEKISKGLGRSVAEVTYMANKMKENSYKLPSEEIQVPEIKVKRKTTKEVPTSDNITNWSQIQQKAFEEALSKYPKGILDRWDKISDRVPDKSKEECMLRFKYLAESFKKQKENPTTEFTETEDNYITYK